MPLQILAQRIGKVLKKIYREPDMRMKKNSYQEKNIPNTPKSVIQRKMLHRLVRRIIRFFFIIIIYVKSILLMAFHVNTNLFF